jgi:hypothetical protein
MFIIRVNSKSGIVSKSGNMSKHSTYFTGTGNSTAVSSTTLYYQDAVGSTYDIRLPITTGRQGFTLKAGNSRL